MKSEIYDKMFLEDPSYGSRRGFDEINKKRMALCLQYFVKGQKIADIGCGYGLQAKHLHERGFNVHAFDFSEEAIRIAKNKNKGPFYKRLDFENERFKEKFEGAYSFDVIEHIHNFPKYLQNIHDSLKIGGYLILTAPNILAPKTRLKMLFGIVEEFASIEHIHFFSPASLSKALRKAGFKEIKIIGSGRVAFLGPRYSGCLYAVCKK